MAKTIIPIGPYHPLQEEPEFFTLTVEGEKVVHALHDYSVVATTSPCGAGKAKHPDWTPLAGKNVILYKSPHFPPICRRFVDAL